MSTPKIPGLLWRIDLNSGQTTVTKGCLNFDECPDHNKQWNVIYWFRGPSLNRRAPFATTLVKHHGRLDAIGFSLPDFVVGKAALNVTTTTNNRTVPIVVYIQITWGWSGYEVRERLMGILSFIYFVLVGSMNWRKAWRKCFENIFTSAVILYETSKSSDARKCSWTEWLKNGSTKKLGPDIAVQMVAVNRSGEEWKETEKKNTEMILIEIGTVELQKRFRGCIRQPPERHSGQGSPTSSDAIKMQIRLCQTFFVLTLLLSRFPSIQRCRKCNKCILNRHWSEYVVHASLPALKAHLEGHLNSNADTSIRHFQPLS